MKLSEKYPFSRDGETITANMVPQYDDGYLLHLSERLKPTLSELLMIHGINSEHVLLPEDFEKRWRKEYVVQVGTGLWKLLTSAALVDSHTGRRRGVSYGTIHELRHTPSLRKRS